jgi:hypothetical protein
VKNGFCRGGLVNCSAEWPRCPCHSVMPDESYPLNRCCCFQLGHSGAWERNGGRIRTVLDLCGCSSWVVGLFWSFRPFCICRCRLLLIHPCRASQILCQFDSSDKRLLSLSLAVSLSSLLSRARAPWISTLRTAVPVPAVPKMAGRLRVCPTSGSATRAPWWTRHARLSRCRRNRYAYKKSPVMPTEVF